MSDEKWIANKNESDVSTEQTKTNIQGTPKAFWIDQDKNSFLTLHWF